MADGSPRGAARYRAIKARLRSGEWFRAGEWEPCGEPSWSSGGTYGPTASRRIYGWPLCWWLAAKFTLRRLRSSLMLLRVAVWLAVAGGVVVFVIGSDLGFFLSLAALLLAALVLSE